METRVYNVDRQTADKILGDEDVKRYGEAKEFQPEALDMDATGIFVVVRGDERIFSKELFKGLEEDEDKEKVLDAIDEVVESAASGVGALFGG